MPQREIERAYNFSMPVFIFPVKIKNAEISEMVPLSRTKF